jgi:integrase/recombinase XerD
MKYSKEWLSKKEIKKLWNFPKINFRDLLLMKVCYSGAFRIGEVLKSKKGDYREEDDYHFLLLRDQKTDKMNWEKQPVQPNVFREVQWYCKANDIKTQDFVFQSTWDRQLSYNSAYKIVKKWVKKAGIKKDITTHSFRRSRATHMLDDGMDLYKVSQFLRHESIETTMNYLKLSKKALYNDMNRIDKKELYNDVI